MSKIRTKTAVDSSDTSYTKTIAIGTALLLLMMAAFWFLNQTYRYQIGADTFATKKSKKPNIPASDTNPKFVDLGTFTVHMSGEDGDQAVQTSIALKLTQQGLEEKAKANLPEIQHHVNMVLQSKRYFELAAYENSENLAQQIKQHVEYVLGFRRASPKVAVGAWADTAPSVKDNGVAAVLFTSFVIQR